MNKTKAVRVKKKPAAAHVMTRVQVKKLLDERDDKCLSAVQDLKRELMGAMAQNHDQTHSKLKRIHEGAIDTYNAMNEGMMDLSDSICNVEEELKRKRWRSKFAKLVEEQDRIEHLLWLMTGRLLNRGFPVGIPL
jgi:exonuclease VII large subunit